MLCECLGYLKYWTRTFPLKVLTGHWRDDKQRLMREAWQSTWDRKF